MRFKQPISVLFAASLSLVLCHSFAPSSLGFDLIGGTKSSNSTAGNDDKSANALAPAIAAFEKRDYSLFQKEYQIVAVYLPLPAEEIFWSRLLVDSGAVQDAIQVLEAYQIVAPNDPEMHIAFAYIAMKSGRWTDAFLQLSKADAMIAQGLLPKERQANVIPGLMQLQAETAIQRKQWSLAEEQYRKLQELLPNDPNPTWQLGVTYALAGRDDDAASTMQLARDKAPQLPCPHLTVASILIAQKSWHFDAEAVKRIEGHFRKSILNNRQDTIVWREYCKWLLALDRSEDVLSYLGKAPDAVKETRDSQLLLAIAMRAEQDFIKSEELLEKLFATYPDDLEISDQLILVLLQNPDESKRSRAKTLADENLSKHPTIENIVATAGWASLCFDEMENADQRLSQLVARGTISPQSAYFVGRFFEKSNRLDDAMRVYQVAINSPSIFPERRALRKQLEEMASKESTEMKKE